MEYTAGAVARGVWAALRAPFWLRAHRLQSLMERPAAGSPAGPDPLPALRTTYRALRLLSAPPRSPWRNTCLYRSVAECLVLRGYGRDARVCIGVRDASAPGAIVAHAWVACPGVPTAGTDGHPEYLPLSHPAAPVGERRAG